MLKLTPFQWSSFNFFGFYCAYGVIVPFLPIWLAQYGYDVELIGTLISLGYLCRFAGAIFFTKSVHHLDQLIPLSRLLTWLSVLVLIAVAWAVQSLWWLIPILALFHMLNGGIMPVCDTIATSWHQQLGMDYGKSRLFGSLAFIIGSITAGYLLGWLGKSAIIGIIIGYLVFWGLGISLNPTQRFNQQEKQNTTVSASYRELLRNPTTVRMIIATALIQGSHAACYAYGTIYWSANGISTSQISWLWSLGVIAEVVFFFFSKRFFRTWKIHYLTLFSALAAVIRWTTLAYTTNFTLLIFAQILHAFTYAMGHFAMIRYITSQPSERIPKLQGIYFASSSCIMMALFTFISGLVYPVSAQMSFALMAIFVLPAIFLVPKTFSNTAK
ncbi:3-phenylpropionate MFS transporter [Avibacterium sp. 20-15]|uniref:3-phenylpropionate MFS transporter n=1 Tax=unclassified Avibacterium TaxID=2685287 RepID=UPI0020262A19|nr:MULTISPECIES: 3-phenylpropionate MFS transporter [unclassified Avibacterium]MCW9734092.1 3-phenylpropionate MFS transporter [Avibacterium sp. 20-15]URL03739.1 3-phenylpropionate MFS transporter [Avibacterium sp. 20-132]